MLIHLCAIISLRRITLKTATYICNKILLDYLALLIGIFMKLFYFVLQCSLSQEFKFANSLKYNKKYIKAFEMLGSKLTFEKNQGKRCFSCK